MKKCRICQSEFEPWNSLQFACSPKCAIDYAKTESQKREYLEAIEGKRPRKVETVSQQHELTQPVFNKWVRLVKDKDETECISCGRARVGFTETAGHFKTVGSAGILRYFPDNVHGPHCTEGNLHKSGNIVEYRPRLIEKIGIERVEFLDSESTKSKKWTIAELKDLRAKYSRLTKESDFSV